MARRRSIMSENLKHRLAEDLGVATIVRREGWGSVPSRECGRLVQKAVELAELRLAQSQASPDRR